MIWHAILTILIASSIEASSLNKIHRRSVSEQNAIIEFFSNCKCVKKSQCKVTSLIKCQTEGLGDELVCCKTENIGQQSIDKTDKFPWLAAVYHRTTPGQFGLRCGGTLVHKKVVLTASHCLDNQSPGDLLVVVNGKEKIPVVNENNEDEKRYVSKIIRHPNYRTDTLFYDAALLILKEKFDVQSTNIKLVKLPPETINLGFSKCFMAGWGELAEGKTSDTIKRVEIPFIEHADCLARLRRHTALGQYFQLHESFLCAGGEKGRDACTGDGGRPLMCKPVGTKHYYQAGIVSWGMGCGDENVPGVYVDVPKIIEWIQNEIDNNT